VIFSGERNGKKHIDMIFEGAKTQTRRLKCRYEVGKTYAVQPKRCAKADPRGRIKILARFAESTVNVISKDDAMAEGGYTPEEYENLFNTMYHEWTSRWTYMFEVVHGEKA